VRRRLSELDAQPAVRDVIDGCLIDTASRFVAQYRNGYINKLLHDGGPDTQIDVKNVALLVSISQCGEAGEQPCAATVQFVATRDREARDCVVAIQFQREDSDDFDKLLINPLGIAASEFPAQCGGAAVG
jgi:hypothetical protein